MVKAPSRRGAGRGRGLRRASVLVVLVGTAFTALVFSVGHRVVDADERRLLEQEASISASALSAMIGQIKGTLDSAGSVAAVTGGDPAAFRRMAATPQAAFFRTLVLLRRDGQAWAPAVTAGTPTARLDDPRGAVVARLASARPGGLVITGFLGSGAARVLSFGGRPSASPDWLVYGEVPLPAPSGTTPPTASNNGAGFPKLDFALYVDTSERSDALVFTNSSRLPFRGRRATVLFALDATQPEPAVLGTKPGSLPPAPGKVLMVMAAKGHLTGGLAGGLPWILLAAGMLSTVAVTTVVETVQRRRDDALRLVGDLEAKNAELDLALAEQARAEHALRASEERFRRVVSSSPDLMVLLEVATGRITVLNRDSVFGHPSAALTTSEQLGALLPDEDRARIGALVADTAPMLDDEVFEVECRLRGAGGDWEWVRTRSKVLERGPGGPAQVLIVFTTITEEKRAEAERARLEEQLRRAHRLEAVGQLAGGIAHDFNNLLAVILNYAGFVAQDLGDHPARADVEEIEKAARRAAELTRQLLVFSRRDVVRPEILDLNEIVAGMERLLRRTLGEDIDLRVTPANGSAQVEADAGELEQVLMNLAVNARDAMDGKGGVLAVRTTNITLGPDDVGDRPELAPGAYVQLTVSDTGCGMSPEVAARAFEPFFTTKGPGRGTGMGLATVYGIATRWRGRVSAYSEPGKGTTMRILLPAAPAGVGRQEPADREPVRPGRGELVLVVEDEPGVRAAARRILQRGGYQVREAPDGDTALAEDVGRIDLLLTDVVMPGGISGRDLADRLQARRAGLPVLFMSGYDDNVIAHRGILEQGVRFIEKPFSEQTLLTAVRDALDGVVTVRTR